MITTSMIDQEIARLEAQTRSPDGARCGTLGVIISEMIWEAAPTTTGTSVTPVVTGGTSGVQTAHDAPGTWVAGL
ncbi:MAG: hypothetical protein JWQ32_3584 [Marmoricola sp.]|jgi:hypothetical protein|nr:hypothetical protein [Marmoricola sp.]